MLLQSHVHSLRPLTTAHLAQTMSLLELNGADLRQKIDAELASNPALEIVDERRCPACHRRLPPDGPCARCSRPTGLSLGEPVVFVSPRGDFHPHSDRNDDEERSFEECVPQREPLPVFVLRQIAPELTEAQRPLAAHLLSSLDDDGLLTVSLLEVSRYHHCPPSQVQAVIALIQRAEPVGVGSSCARDALLVQLEVLSETRPIPPGARRAIQEGLDLLARRAYPELGARLGITAGEAQTLAQFIVANLNPYPARAHWGPTGDPAPTPGVYHQPDVLITRQTAAPDAPLVVEVLSPYAGALRVNPLFRQVIADAPAGNASGQVQEWQGDLDRASLLVKCLQQRDHTLVRLMQRLAVYQRSFILMGDEALRPLTRAHLADELEVHESTISRAVSDKSVQLPSGQIIPMSKFFDRSLNVRAVLRQIVAAERLPLSDTQIATQLTAQGYDVARRTVAKYRMMEGILPARLRRPLAAP